MRAQRSGNPEGSPLRCPKCGGPRVQLSQSGELVCAAECSESLPHMTKRIALEEWNAALAKKLRSEMPEGRGYVLVSFDFGVGGSMAYASNANRTDAMHMLRELVSKMEKSPR